MSLVRILLASAALLIAGPAFAETLDAEARFAGERLTFDVRGDYTNFTVTVSGPEGYYAQAQGARSAPTLRLRDYGDVPDGSYSYQLVAATGRVDTVAARVDQRVNGREPGTARPRVGASTTGRFQVINGRIVPFEALEESSSQ